jgi:hypothetical protein
VSPQAEDDVLHRKKCEAVSIGTVDWSGISTIEAGGHQNRLRLARRPLSSSAERGKKMMPPRLFQDLQGNRQHEWPRSFTHF